MTTHDALYLVHAEQLKALDAHMIYTVPISMFYSIKATQLLCRCLILYSEIRPTVTTAEEAGSPDKEGIELSWNSREEGKPGSISFGTRSSGISGPKERRDAKGFHSLAWIHCRAGAGRRREHSHQRKGGGKGISTPDQRVWPHGSR